MRSQGVWSRVVQVTLLVTVASGFGPPPRLRETPASDVPTTAPGRALEGFLAATNSGDFETIRRFIAGHPGFRTSGPGRFLEIHRAYGPLDLVWIQSSDSMRITAWARGRRTRAPIGIVLQVQAGRAGFIDWLGIDVRDVPPDRIRRAALTDETALAAEVRSWARANRDGPFSGVVAVARNGRPIVEVAVGDRDPGGSSITTDDAFYLASVSKVFVGLAAARLVGAGALRWDATISGYLSEFPAGRIAGITIEHLLTHRSGLEFDEDSTFRRRVASARTVADMVRSQAEALSRLPADTLLGPLREPNYSNEGYVAAARIVEVVAGVPYDRYLKEALSPSFGLRRTVLFDPERPPGRFARPWTGRRWSDGSAVPGPLRLAVPAGLGPPSGGVVSTAADLERLGDAILRRHGLPPAVWDEVLAGGFGLDVERDADGTAVRIGHSGNEFGASAEFWVFPRTGYVVVALANRERAARVASQYLNELVPR